MTPTTSAHAPARLDVSVEDPAAWARAHRAELLSALDEHGALVVRGLALADHTVVAEVFNALAKELLDDREAFAARQSRGPGVWSSATWPDNEPMCMHHELSYRAQMPALLLLACLRAPQTGGATAVADAHEVLSALPEPLVADFVEHGWLLVRNLGGDIGPGVADVFGTEDRGAVEAYCAAHDIEVTWRPEGGLTTRQRRPAVLTHPRSGRSGFVNQVAFLSEWTLPDEVRDYVMEVYGPDGLPFVTRFGNDEPIGPEAVETIQAVYDSHTRRASWEAGDLMLLDNLATAHTRDAFTGAREVLLGLADPFSLPRSSR